MECVSVCQSNCQFFSLYSRFIQLYFIQFFGTFHNLCVNLTLTNIRLGMSVSVHHKIGSTSSQGLVSENDFGEFLTNPRTRCSGIIDSLSPKQSGHYPKIGDNTARSDCSGPRFHPHDKTVITIKIPNDGNTHHWEYQIMAQNSKMIKLNLFSR